MTTPAAAPAQKITPFLWFDSNAEEAVNFYVSLFPDSKVLDTLRYGDAGPGPAGSVMTIDFTLQGQRFTALNGGPHFKFNEAISFHIHCVDQAEVDKYWAALTDGGEIQQCGWVRDKFGLSWQVVPEALMEMLKDKDTERATRVMGVMMQMKKLDIAPLQQAYDGN